MGAGAAIVRAGTSIILVDPGDVAVPTAPTVSELTGAGAIRLEGTDDLGEGATALSGGDKSTSTINISRVRSMTDEKVPAGTEINDISIDIVQSKDPSENVVRQSVHEGDDYHLYVIEAATPTAGALGWHYPVTVASKGSAGLDLSGAHTLRLTFTCRGVNDIVVDS